MPFVFPPIPPDEEARLAALLGCGILDTPAEAAFDDITRLIADICDTPIAIVTLIDRDRQWFKSALGAGDITETPRDIAFCAHAILQPEMLIVPDMRLDPRFAENPLVTQSPHVRFYAGAAMRTRDGYPLGTLCVLDVKPRTLTEKQQNALCVLAREAMTQIELRQRVHELEAVIEEREQARQDLVRAEQKQRHVAETLQRSLLLAPPPDAFAGLKFAHFYEPAWDEAQVGGDFYDMFALGGNKVALVVGDVVGKGLVAASYTAEVKFTLRSFLREGSSPQNAFDRLNRVVIQSGIYDRAEDESSVYVALLAAVLDTKTGELTAASAGAEPPFILHHREARMEELELSGAFIGADMNTVFEQATQTLLPGDALLMFTDGITEARQKQKRAFFGPEGIVQTTLSVCAETADASPNAIGQAVLDAAHAFASGKLHDDACLLVACLHCGDAE